MDPLTIVMLAMFGSAGALTLRDRHRNAVADARQEGWIAGHAYAIDMAAHLARVAEAERAERARRDATT